MEQEAYDYTTKDVAKRFGITVRAIQHHAKKWERGYRRGKYIMLTADDIKFIESRLGKPGKPKAPVSR